MSVINQMLKDLEERAPKSENVSNQVTAIEQKKSRAKVVSLIVVSLVVLNGLGLYIWFLVQENQQLKEKAAFLVKPKAQTKVQLKTVQPMPQLKMLTTESKVIKQVQLEAKLPEKSQVKVITTEPLKSDLSNGEIGKPAASKALVSKTSVSKTLVSKESDLAHNELKPTEVELAKDKPKASMSVSRRQLLPEELIAQKLTKAEKAINANQLSKAEQLFEEVLIIEPEQHQARKKLAALWFGRKAFNDAINLLSQGIALAPNNSEFRSMVANIFLQQGNLTQAYKSLRPLADLQQQTYQLLIANISQQLSEYDAAIKAYKILLAMQPGNSRWHLGLAIVYDKNSQFVLAVDEYSLALENRSLSSDSSQFANQRIQALGVK